MKLTVKIIGKEVTKTDGSKFTSFSVLTAKQNWYNVAGIDPKEMKKFEGQIATLDVERKYTKKATTRAGHELIKEVLYVVGIAEPTYEEAKAYADTAYDIHQETLADVE